MKVLAKTDADSERRFAREANPYEVGPPPSARRPALTPDADRVILTALAKKKEARFGDAAAMAEALRLTSLFASYTGA